MTKCLMPFDELNRLKEKTVKLNGGRGKLKNQLYDELEDELIDLLIFAYLEGCRQVNTDMGTQVEPSTDSASETILKPIAGSTFIQRLSEYRDNDGTVDDFLRIAETEMHRDYNEGAFETAMATGAGHKRWHTMMDERVRETHSFIEGVDLPITAEYYTFDGDHSLYPGGFTMAENNVGCRCWLTYS